MREVKRALAVLALGSCAMAGAHDFWIDLPVHRVAPGATVAARFLVGEAGAAEPWALAWRRIVSLRAYGPDGVIDEQPGVEVAAPGVPGRATIRFAGPGTYVVALESTLAESDLPADEFNAYARHEGLTAALVKRTADGTMAARGRETYSRRAKAIVQVGHRLTDQVTMPIGQTLEIVPVTNPYRLRDGQKLTLRLLYRGLPLAGAALALERLDKPGGHAEPSLTDSAGQVSFSIERHGRWRAAAVWTQPTDHPRADFDTVFATLTFGY